jgi:hypothetical protein
MANAGVFRHLKCGSCRFSELYCLNRITLPQLVEPNIGLTNLLTRLLSTRLAALVLRPTYLIFKPPPDTDHLPPNATAFWVLFFLCQLTESPEVPLFSFPGFDDPNQIVCYVSRCGDMFSALYVIPPSLIIRVTQSILLG